MGVDTNHLTSLFDKLKVDDPWLPPRPWESIPSESGLSHSRSQCQCQSHSSQEEHPFDTSSVSELSLVRLAMNALQGVESAVISIEKLSAAFCSDAADRSFHRITSLWNCFSSTHALGKILKDIGSSGCLVLLLRKFVEHFAILGLDDKSVNSKDVNSDAPKNENFSGNELKKDVHLPYSLVNQAFAVAVAKILEGYIFSLDTLHASIGFRRPLRGTSCPVDASSGEGCLSSVVLSDISLLEVYLHTVELRTRIEAVVNICKLHNVALCFSVSSLEEVLAKAAVEFRNFPIGGNLLTYLYEQLKVADPTHLTLLKFLFLRSCEPYCLLIRSWIYQAEINDPYEEFIVECANESTLDQSGISYFLMKNVLVRDRVVTPCFLKESLIPLVRAGQQLHVLMKLFELYNYDALGNINYYEFLPSWKGFSFDPSSPSSPLAFSKENIEALVHARNNYYVKMQENLEKFWVKLKARNQEGSPCSNLPFLDSWENSGRAGPSIAPVTEENKGSIWVAGDFDSNNDDQGNELSQVDDVYESEDCSSSYISDEQIESEELIGPSINFACLEQNYLSALKFSLDRQVGSALEINRVCKDEETFLHVDLEQKHLCGANLSSHHNVQGQCHYAFPLQKEELNQYSPLKSRCSNFSPLKDPEEISLGCRLHLSDLGTSTGKRNIKICGNTMPSFKGFPPLDAHEEGVVENEHCTIEDDYSSLFNLQPLNNSCHSNLLSLNPMLTKNAFTRSIDKPWETFIKYSGQLLPYFDFSSVDNPLKVCEEKLAAPLCDYGSQLHCPVHFSDSASGLKKSCLVEKVTDLDSINSDDSNYQRERAPSSYIFGGSGWESMLASCRHSTISNEVRDDEEHLIADFDMPIDLAVEKCILQEIMLQYNYVSKMTIKFLEEGFDLQQHLLALRRYYFMEVADWADLFIMSLLKHKKLIAEAGQRILEIQGLFKIAIQRSSCERDQNKQRLFVYFKGEDTAIDSTYATGIQCLELLGLGYRVNWPVNIILTPAALKIYSEIFNFLIKVRLAAFSLTDIWSLLTDLRHSIDQNCQSELQKQKVNHFRILSKFRNQLNHFVSMLQQYVHSQLSHVSWCRFLHSLQNKVKDMMDLESVHMGYLSDCLEICFLSDEMHAVGSVIKNALQCAVDFQFCLSVGARGDFFGNFSAIIVPQVREIKQRFEKNMRDLHLIYLRSSKHGKFGLSCFWHYLNYNEYYAEDSNHYGL